MSDEPVLPLIPSIGDILIRKNMEELKFSVIKCNGCNSRNIRSFMEGDFLFKEFEDENCSKCNGILYQVIEIYAEFKKINKNQSKK